MGLEESNGKVNQSITIEYVTKEDVNKYLFETDKGLVGIVQQFIDPKDDHNSKFWQFFNFPFEFFNFLFEI